MRLDLEKLEATGGRFAQAYKPAELPFEDGEFQLIAPAEVRGQVARREGAAEMRGELHTKVAVACSRCLQSVELPIDVEFSERFVPAVSWRDEELHELQQEDLNLSVLEGETIDVDNLVKEQITLAIPGHVLCREDCQGLCPICGTNRNADICHCETKEVDSRWEKLRDLRF